jgi:trimeric autotransporter adhesin
MPTFAARTGLVFGLICASLATPSAFAQLCEENWLPQGQIPGADLSITTSLMWDPDGTGPRTPVLVVAGQFSAVGGIRANRIATYDLRTGVWAPLGEGVDGGVNALAVAPDNSLLVGGTLFTAGGLPARDLARWNGSTWSSLNLVSSPGVHAICVLPNNSIVIGGPNASVPGRSLQILEGTSWRQIGGVFEQNKWGGVYSLASIRRPSGAWRLLVGGEFRAANQSFENIASFDGIGWSSFGQIPATVDTILSVSTGTNSQDIYAALRNATVVKWNGTAWQQLGGTFSNDLNPGWVLDLAAIPETSGGYSLFATGQFARYNGAPASNLARWTGEDWVPVNGGLGPVSVFPDGAAGVTLCPVPFRGAFGLFAGGEFSSAGNVGAHNAAIFSRGTWSPLGQPNTFGASDDVFAIAQISPDELVIGGRFLSAGGIQMNRIAKRTSSSATPWVQLGSGMNDNVSSLASLGSGQFLAGGAFTSAGDTPANRIARWDGRSWNSLGSGLNGIVNTIVVLPSGEFVVSGSFTSAGGTPARGIAKWDGESWSALGTELQGSIFDLAVVPRADGINWDLYAGGRFDFGSSIARWTGTNWTPVGSGVRLISGQRGSIYALEALPRASGGNDLIAAGYFDFAGSAAAKHVARWDGSVWTAVGNIGGGDEFAVYNLAAVPSRDGQTDLVASGIFEFGQRAFISRFTGNAWESWPGFVPDLGYGQVSDMAALRNSPDNLRLAVGGSFTSISGGDPSPHFALWGCATCRADFNRDGTLEFFDYLDFVFAFDSERQDADFDRNGSIDFFDYLEFVAAFEAGC